MVDMEGGTEMSYLVFCTFDLKNASSQDYHTAYSDLAALGLQKVQKADDGAKRGHTNNLGHGNVQRI